MPNWKKVIVSGSDATLNSLLVTNAITASIFSGSQFTGSFYGTASWAVSSSKAITASYALFADSLADNIWIRSYDYTNSTRLSGSAAVAIGINSVAYGSTATSNGNYSHAEGSGVTGTAGGGFTSITGDSIGMWDYYGNGSAWVPYYSGNVSSLWLTRLSLNSNLLGLYLYDPSFTYYSSYNANTVVYDAGNNITLLYNFSGGNVIGATDDSGNNQPQSMTNLDWSGDDPYYGIGGEYAHAEGVSTSAQGTGSYAEGNTSLAYGDYSHAEGYSTAANGNYSHAEGNDTTASGIGAHSEGNITVASGNYSHAEGSGTTASGGVSHAEGQSTTASGGASHAEGGFSTASGSYSHAEGSSTIASGISSHAEGNASQATSDYSHAEGSSTIASGISSHAEGGQTEAGGNYSHAEGFQTKAQGLNSHAEGYQTLAFGVSSHAEGRFTTASGEASHTGGIGTIADGDYQYVVGKYNVNNYLEGSFIIGNGTNDGNRSNLLATSGSTVTISNILTLTPIHPLPSGVATGSFAVSSSSPPKPYFYNGTSWNALY